MKKTTVIEITTADLTEYLISKKMILSERIKHITLIENAQGIRVVLGERRDDYTESQRQFLDTKLVDLDISVRLANCLYGIKVRTVGDILDFSEADLMKQKSFGKKSLSELKNVLATKNLKLKTTLV